MIISVIIPTLNEHDNIVRLIPYLHQCAKYYELEIIVVDAHSTDKTADAAISLGAKVILSEKACRAHQMNLGAKRASAPILYFLHADSLPPKTLLNDIIDQVNAKKNIGCYRFKFDTDNLMLSINSYFTRFSFLWCRGGDQSLYITKQLFEQLDGFDEHFVIMEDFNLIRRAKKLTRFNVMAENILVSARKYKRNSYLRLNLVNLYIFILFQLNYDPARLKMMYAKLLNH